MKSHFIAKATARSASHAILRCSVPAIIMDVYRWVASTTDRTKFQVQLKACYVARVWVHTACGSHAQSVISWYILAAASCRKLCHRTHGDLPRGYLLRHNVVDDSGPLRAVYNHSSKVNWSPV